jgi:Trk K+ transport system NAD-binding subunit
MLPPESIITLVVDPAGAPRIPAGDTVLNAGDALVIVTRKDGLDSLKEALVGATHGLDT